MVKSAETLERLFVESRPKSVALYESGMDVMPGGGMKGLGYSPPLYIERLKTAICTTSTASGTSIGSTTPARWSWATVPRAW